MTRKLHLLKTWPDYFDPVLRGRKTFDIRKNDREFQEGDLLTLMEYDPSKNEYSGKFVTYRAGYILQGMFGLPDDVCVISLQPEFMIDTMEFRELLRAALTSNNVPTELIYDLLASFGFHRGHHGLDQVKSLEREI